MPSITIRDLDEGTREQLRARAARHRRSVEEEAKSILRAAVTVDEAGSTDLASAIRERFRSFGGVELAIPARDAMREPPKPAK